MNANSDGVFSVEDVQDGWHVHAWFELRDGAPRITELRLRSATGSTLRAAHGGGEPQPNYGFEAGRKVPLGGITAEVLRSLSLKALHDALGKDNASAMLLGVHGFSADEDFRAMRQPGRRGRDDRFYVVWAQRYVATCATTRRPYPALAAEWNYSERTIRDFVDKARKRGLLIGGSPGRAGGQLSAKAKRLLERGDTQ
jgi:hypothetical protein